MKTKNSKNEIENIPTLQFYKNKNYFKLQDNDMESNNGISMTVPGEAYTIAELLLKHTQGIYPQIANEGTFEENVDFDSDIIPTDFDLTQLDENRDKITLLKQKISEANLNNSTKKIMSESDQLERAKGSNESEAKKSDEKTNKKELFD